MCSPNGDARSTDASSHTPGARWTQWGGDVVVLVTDPRAIAAARAEVERVLEQFDRACSRFRADSDLERVNAAAGRPVAVSDLFLESLEAAMRAARLSMGAVDPTVGEALVLAGYDRDFALLDTDGPGRARRAVRVTRAPGLAAIDCDRDRATVMVARGVRLDLGATAKALAADRCAAAAREATGIPALVSLAGDLAVSGPAPAGGWTVRVAEDHRAPGDAPAQTISIFDGGLATSSTTVRRWREAGEERHHIIDPDSGRPAEVVWRTVTVAAGSCLDANTAATATIVMGHAGTDWLRETGLPARLVGSDGTTRVMGDWPVEALV